MRRRSSSEPLFAGRGGLSRRGRRRGKRIDHLARTRVVKFFAGLVLDGIGIVLQPLDVTFQQLVLSLQALHLIVQHLCITVFLLVGGQPILSEDNVVADSNS